METKDLMESSSAIPVAIPPIILVPNLGGLLVPPLQNGVQYVVAAEPDTEQTLSDRVIREDEKPKPEDVVSADQKEQLLGHKTLPQEVKSISPMQLFNIQDSSETGFLGSEEAGIMFGKFSESPLLHESSKDVTLVSRTHDLLDEIGPSKGPSGFVEPSSSSEAYLFTPLSENALEQLAIHSGGKCEVEEVSDKSPAKMESASLPKSSETAIEETKRLINVLEKNIAGHRSESVEACEEVKAEEESRAVVVHIPESPSFNAAEVLKEELHVEFDSSCNKTISCPILIPTSSIDISLIPFMPVESLMFGNLALMPSSSTPIKFQVVDNDGTIKRISVNPICPTEQVLMRTNISADTGTFDGGSVTSGPASPLIAEIIPSSECRRPFKCDLCSATFTRFGNYTRHKKIHTVPTKEDQRFHCEICGKSFIQRCDLTRHMHIHSGTEPHRCTICGKGYIRHSDLVIHQRFHNKEKPFCCPHCAKGFSQRGDLNRHLRSIHLQVKPLTCGHCQKKFAKEATLIRHMQVTHRDIILSSITKCSSDKYFK